MEYTRRLKDRSGDHDWPDDIRNSGIENRIFFAAPNDEIHLRAGIIEITDTAENVLELDTLEMICNRMRDLTWRDVMEILAQRSIIDRTDNTFYVKRVEGFGKKEKSDHPDDLPEFTLSEVIQKHFREVEASLDIRQREGLRALVEMKLRYEERRSHVKYRTLDLRHIIPDLTRKITEYLFGKDFSQNEMCRRHFNEVWKIISSDTQAAGETNNFGMVNSWAGSVTNAVRFK